MATVFIAGSIKIKRLDPLFIERIENVVREGMQVVVGDANGADTSIQKELLRLRAEKVIVFCADDKPRNNVGQWPVERVRASAAPGTRAFFTAKDVEMASRADFGLMLWDAASTGTLSNVLQLLARQRKCVVFVNKQRSFVNVKEKGDILELVSVMSDGARRMADKKIGLGAKISTLMNEQLGLSL